MKRFILLMLISVSVFGTSYAQNSKYEKAIEFSGLFETKQSLLKNVSALGLTFVNGYRTNDKLFIGGGIGVDYSTWQSLGYSSVYDDYSVSIPIFARAKVDLIDSNISPYLSFDLGYNLMIGSSDDYSFAGISDEYAYKRSGLFVSPTVGVDFELDDANSLYVGFSYLFNVYGENNHSYSHTISSLGFRVGWIF